MDIHVKLTHSSEAQRHNFRETTQIGDTNLRPDIGHLFARAGRNFQSNVHRSIFSAVRSQKDLWMSSYRTLPSRRLPTSGGESDGCVDIHLEWLYTHLFISFCSTQ